MFNRRLEASFIRWTLAMELRIDGSFAHGATVSRVLCTLRHDSGLDKHAINIRAKLVHVTDLFRPARFTIGR